MTGALHRLGILLVIVVMLLLRAAASNADVSPVLGWLIQDTADQNLYDSSLGSAGDFNGDGHLDLFAAAHRDGPGHVYIYHGGSFLDEEPDLDLCGEAAGDYFGLAAANAGDFNGDGFQDLLIGAWSYDMPQPRSGRAYIYFGGTDLDASPDVIIQGPNVYGSYLGHFVSSAGDVNADGYADVLVSAYAYPQEQELGRAYLYYGSSSPDGEPDLWLDGEAYDDRFGASLAGGDVNGDGYSDIIIGADMNGAGGTQDGYVKVYLGPNPDGAPELRLTSVEPADRFGGAVTALDFNGDGFSDIVVSAHVSDVGASDAGTIYVFFGGSPMDSVADLTRSGEGAGDRFGAKISRAGDLNSDGYDDLLVSSYLNDVGSVPDAGKVYIFFGSATPDLIPDHVILGNTSYGNLGTQIASAGDVDDNGYEDFLIGTQPDYPSATPGRAELYLMDVMEGSIVGRVLADCPTSGSPLYGVSVDLYDDATGALLSEITTDAQGQFFIPQVSAGSYTVTIVTPLGYQAMPDEVPLEVVGGQESRAEFFLDCELVVVDPHSQGYWKHQLAVANGGNGRAQIDAETLCNYLDLIDLHFNSNELNPVRVYMPPIDATCAEKLVLAYDLLNLKGQQLMQDRARQQLMALLLNVAGQKLHLTGIVSEDGATVSQAITYCDNVIDDPYGDHERVKDIAEWVNTGRTLPAGWVPLSTAQIAYRQGIPPAVSSMALLPNVPNPFNPRTVIRFRLPRTAPYEIGIYDTRAQRVWETRGLGAAGVNEIHWLGLNSDARSVASGVYHVFLQALGESRSLKIVLTK